MAIFVFPPELAFNNIYEFDVNIYITAHDLSLKYIKSTDKNLLDSDKYTSFVRFNH